MKISLFSIAAILIMQGCIYFNTANDTTEPIIVEPIPVYDSSEVIDDIKEDVIVVEIPETEVVVEEEKPITNRWGIELTEDEIDMLAKIAFLEAHTQSEDGVSAVIEVVFNRMVSDDFPDTLEGVLSQSKPCVQFTTWKNLDIAEPTEKEYSMIYAALNGEKEVLTTEYVFFSRGKQNNNDPKKIEDHWFCKGY